MAMASQRSATILIAEDSATQAARLAHLLGEHGYRVVTARNGCIALAQMREELPDLLITDVVMPEMDGYSLCRAIKNDAALRTVPVMLVTTLSDAEDLIRGLECGADNFIRKPYDDSYLLSRVEYLLMNVRLRTDNKVQLGIEISLSDRKHFITAERQQILDLLISTYEQAVQINTELTQREKSLGQANQVLSGLYRIAEGLNRATTEQEVAEFALDRAMELPGVACGWIFLREGSAGGFRLAAARNLPPALDRPLAMADDCNCRRACVSGALRGTTNVTDCERLTAARGDTRGLRCHATVPLWLEDDTIGVMNLVGPEQGIFSQEELRILDSVGNQVALALDRTRLLQRLEKLVEARTADLEAEIAERKRTEESLRRSQSMLQMAGRIGRLGAWTENLDATSVTWSDEVRAILGVADDYAGGLEDLLAFLDSEYRDLFRDRFQRCRTEGRPFDLEGQIVSARGHRVWIRVIGEGDRGPDGRISRIHGALQDISSIKEAAETSRKLAERLTNTMESITDAFVTVDRDWKFTYVNGRAERLLRLPKSEVLGRRLWDVLPAAQGSRFEQEYLRAMRDGTPVEFEEPFEPFGGWFEVRAYPSAEGLAIYVRDVTEQRRAREERRESEERFRTLTEAMPQIVWMISPEGEGLYANKRWVEYTGLSLDRSSGEGWTGAYHPDDLPAMVDAWNNARRTGGTMEAKCRLRAHDGAYRWFLIRGLPLTGVDGGIAGWLGTGTDVDELQQALDRIADQAELIDEANDAIVVRNLEQEILFWNRGAEKLYGFTAEQAIGRRYDDMLLPDREAFAAAERALLENWHWGGVLEMQRAAGSVVPVEGRWTLVRDEQGAPKSILTIDADISDRRRAELQLQESEERYRLLFDRNPHPAWVYDIATLAFLAVNDAAVREYGYSREEFLSMTLMDIRPPEERENLARVLREASDAPDARYYGVFRHRSRQGKILEVEVKSSEIPFGGRRAGLVIATDVTERRALERQFLRAQRMESIGTLAGGIAHDLNNLLMPIMMGVTLLRRVGEGPQSVRALDNIERSARRGKDLVTQVLSFARGVEGARVPVQLGDIVREVRSIVESTFPKNVSLSTDIAPDLWSVSGDPTQLNQVLLNLCVNARDAMPQGGRLTLSVRNVEIDSQYAQMHRGLKAGSHVLLEAVDEGAGIPPEIVDRIFEPFFTTKEVGSGSGLGLSTVAAIVRSHDGAVNVYSEPGKGTSFRVYLPARKEVEANRAENVATGDELPRGNGELVLVVDDEASILEITAQTLDAFGYRVLTAEDGAHAIATYAQYRHEIAAVITDMMMPLMDGPALIAALRRIEPDVKVITSSGLGDNPGTTTRAGQVGVKHFLHKPYSAEVLLRTLAGCLESES